MGISLKTTTGKLLASGALLATAAAVAGLGTYGSFTSSTAASATVGTGTVSIVLGSNSSLAVPAAGLLPGDKIMRLASISNTGDQNLNAVTLTTSTAAPSLLTTDTTNGLQINIDACSVPWTGTAAPFTCTGTTTVVLAKTPVITANQALTNLTSVTAGKTDNLMVTATLPDTAPNTFQAQQASVNFAFNATQRTAAIK